MVGASNMLQETVRLLSNTERGAAMTTLVTSDSSVDLCRMMTESSMLEAPTITQVVTDLL